MFANGPLRSPGNCSKGVRGDKSNVTQCQRANKLPHAKIAQSALIASLVATGPTIMPCAAAQAGELAPSNIDRNLVQRWFDRSCDDGRIKLRVLKYLAAAYDI